MRRRTSVKKISSWLNEEVAKTQQQSPFFVCRFQYSTLKFSRTT